jgi:hypothetical protein
MKKRLFSVVFARESRDSGPFLCLTERWPWLQLVDAINVLDRRFLEWPSMWTDEAGRDVESYKHVEFVFSQAHRGMVMVLAKSEYGEHILRRALAWVDNSQVCLCS